MLFYDNGRVESFSNAEYPYKECAIIGNRECAKFVEIIDECKYKYVLELFEMWNDKYAKKRMVIASWVLAHFHDQFCTDEVGLFL